MMLGQNQFKPEGFEGSPTPAVKRRFQGMFDVSKAVAKEYGECVHGGQAAGQDENPSSCGL